MVEVGFDGYVVGGFSVGEIWDEMLELLVVVIVILFVD